MTTTIIDTKDIESNLTPPTNTSTTTKPVPSSNKKWIILSVIAMLSIFGIFYSFYSSTSLEEVIKSGDETLVLKIVKEMIFKDDALLHTYCDTIQFPLVKRYLEDKYSVVGKADDKVDGLTIHEAFEKGDLLAVKIFVLVKKDIDIDAKDNFGWTALHYASLKGHIDVVEFLLLKGSVIDAGNNFKMTALHYASYHGHIDVVKLLLSKGSVIDADNDFGKTALHYASENGHEDLVELLLSKGSDINAKDKNGKTALQLAKDENIIAMLTTHAEIL